MNTPKRLLRKKYTQNRSQLSQIFQIEASKKIQEKLIQRFQIFFTPKNPQQNSGMTRIVALFASVNGEVDLLPLLQLNQIPNIFIPQSPNENSGMTWNFVFPKVKNLKNGQMEFYHVESFDDLEEGSFGILEPKKYCSVVAPQHIDIFCVPALAIDSEGNRLGMGGGFYDRYLITSKTNALKIGVVFSSQISEEIFVAEDWDIGMDMVVSEADSFEI